MHIKHLKTKRDKGLIKGGEKLGNENIDSGSRRPQSQERVAARKRKLGLGRKGKRRKQVLSRRTLKAAKDAHT